MKTAITDMFGIDVPILAFSHCRDVVAAVSKAGGMGVLGAVAHSQRQLEIDLDWIEDEIGDRPYGVDLIVPAKYAGSDAGEFTLDDVRALIPPEHIAFVDDILRRYDVPDLPDDDKGHGFGGGRGDQAAPFSAESAAPNLEIALAHRSALVVNALGPPPAHMIERVKEEGRLVGALAGKAQHAERHVNAGVDVIVAQGYEAGGHTGEIGTMVLIPEIVDAVAPVPVLGAGGIGTGPSDGGRDGTRCARRVVRLGVADDRGGRDASRREAEVPRRHVGRHDPIAIPHRQARPPVEVGVDRRMGEPRHARAARHADATGARSTTRSSASIGRHTGPVPAPRSSPTTSSARSSAR